ncbi:hypothetical protein AHAS_Ahas18G0156300 [Arachis hypogaea]
MNRLRLRGKNVFVGEAKYRRSSGVTTTRSGERGAGSQNLLARKPQNEVVPNDAGSSGCGLRMKEAVKGPHNNGWTKKLEVAMAKENLIWLQRSLVGGTTKPINFDSLKETIAKNIPYVVQVREIGAYKALLSFDGAAHAEETYTLNMNRLLHLFHSVWRWEESEHSETRRVWLECFGVLLHAWSVDTFKRIGGQWDEVVGCARETESCSSFTVGRVQIDTCLMDRIQEWVHISVGTGGYDVFVKEIGHEACDLHCNERLGDQKIINREQRNHGRTSKVPGVDLVQQYQYDSLDEDDHEEEMLLLVTRGEEEDKGRLGIQHNFLNEWTDDNNYHNCLKIVTDQVITGDNQGKADLRGGTVTGEEAGSERTVTCVLNGLAHGSTKAKQNAVPPNTTWASNKIKLVKGVKGQMVPTSEEASESATGLSWENRVGCWPIHVATQATGVVAAPTASEPWRTTQAGVLGLGTGDVDSRRFWTTPSAVV